MKNQKRFNILLIVLCFALIGLDQFTKFLAVTGLKNKPAIPIIEGVFELNYLENTGAAFGILQGQKWILLLITIIELIVLVVLYIKLPYEKKYIPLKIIDVFVIAGAIGNIIDRVLYNYVVDFFYFKLIDFPIFNVADIYVTVSVLLLFVLFLFYYKEEDFDAVIHNKIWRKNNG